VIWVLLPGSHPLIGFVIATPAIKNEERFGVKRFLLILYVSCYKCFICFGTAVDSYWSKQTLKKTNHK